MLGAIALGIFSFTGCSLFKNDSDSQYFSRTRLEKLEDTVDTVVEDYFNEKYGVEAVVTYKGIAGGIFLGYNPSSVQYYNVTVMITDNDIESKYYVEVHGRVTDGADELYVKSESYFRKLMENKMIQWIDSYILQTGLKDYMIEYSGMHTCFPSEYSTGLTAEEFITLIFESENEGIK